MKEKIIITEEAHKSFLNLEKNNIKDIGLIYGHYNIETGKWYCGETVCLSPSKRWGKDGYNYIRLNPDTKFSKAIIEYGWEKFEHYILYYCEEKDLFIKESEFINKLDSFNNGYNSNAGLGKEVSLETRKKQSLSQKGHSVSQKTLDALKKANKDIIRVQKRGKENPAARAVIMINSITNEEIKRFDTVKDAADFCNIKSQTNITKCCRGYKKTAGAFDGIPLTWKFVDEKFINKKIKPMEKNHKDLISKNRKGKAKGKDCVFSKEIVMLFFNEKKILKTFSNAREAAEYLNKPGIASHIRSCCKGLRKTAGSIDGKRLTWRYNGNTEESEN